MRIQQFRRKQLLKKAFILFSRFPKLVLKFKGTNSVSVKEKSEKLKTPNGINVVEVFSQTEECSAKLHNIRKLLLIRIKNLLICISSRRKIIVYISGSKNFF